MYASSQERDKIDTNLAQPVQAPIYLSFHRLLTAPLSPTSHHFQDNCAVSHEDISSVPFYSSHAYDFCASSICYRGSLSRFHDAAGFESPPRPPHLKSHLFAKRQWRSRRLSASRRSALSIQPLLFNLSIPPHSQHKLLHNHQENGSSSHHIHPQQPKQAHYHQHTHRGPLADHNLVS